MADRIKLIVDKPVHDSLAFAKGRFGKAKEEYLSDWYMYTLASGSVMFLETRICQDPDELFAAKNIGKGEPFVIVLRKRGGEKYYEVHKLSDAAEPDEEPHLDPSRYPDDSGQFTGPSAASVLASQHARKPAGTRKARPGVVEPPTDLEAKLAASIPAQQRRAAGSNIAPPPAASCATAPNPIAIVPPPQPRAGSVMASALVAAIDAVLTAQSYATSKGSDLVFGPDQVQAIACTLYIQHAKEHPQFAQRAGGRQ